jgi:hypothetical protein
LPNFPQRKAIVIYIPSMDFKSLYTDPPTLLHFFIVVVIVIETESHYVAQVGLKFMILLPTPPECWDY